MRLHQQQPPIASQHYDDDKAVTDNCVTVAVRQKFNDP